MNDYIATDADGTITLYHYKPTFFSEDLGCQAFWGGITMSYKDYEVLVYPESPVFVINAGDSLRKGNDISKYKFKPKYQKKNCTKFAQKKEPKPQNDVISYLERESNSLSDAP